MLHTHMKSSQSHLTSTGEQGTVNLPDFESQQLSTHPILYFIDPPGSLRNEGSKSWSPFDGRVWPGAREDEHGDPNGIRSLWSLLTVWASSRGFHAVGSALSCPAL